MSETISDFVEQIREKAIQNIEKRLQFGEELTSGIRDNGMAPFPSQIMRVYEAIENGTKRVLFADATGFGKTYVVAMIHGLLNKKKNKRHKTLLIAPQQSLQTAWREEEINSYLEGLGLQNGRPLKIAELGRNNLDDVLRGNDVVCFNYHKFNCTTSDRYVNAVLELAPKIDMVVFDESQNNKSFGKRGQNFKKLIDRTKNKRVLMLSATPGQNGPEDLGIPLHILDTKNFPFAKFDYNLDPEAIKDMIVSGQWFNSDREIVKALFNLPPLVLNNPVYCDIGNNYGRKYLNVWKNGSLNIGSKIALLRKYSLLGKIRSPEGRRFLEELLESRGDDAIVTFTHLKTGVAEPLFQFLERFYGKGKVGMINGDVKDVRDRIEIAKRFNNGEYRALANSLLTMGEGVPCTAGEMPVSVLFLEMPQNHGQLNQGIGRVWRCGQKAEVNVFYILGKNDFVRDEMNWLVESGELQRKYDVVFPESWRPSLIDEDIYEILLKKDEIDRNYIRRGIVLDDFLQKVMEYNEGTVKGRKAAEVVLKSLPRKVKGGQESAMSLFARTNYKLVGIGEHRLYLASVGNGNLVNPSKFMANAYLDEKILESSSGDTTRMIKQIIDNLESRGYEFKDLLDLGSGTGIVSRVLGREMINLDLDRRMLNAEGFWLGPRVQGFMTQLPFKNNSFNLATASYSLFYNGQRENEREIEKILRETNRVLTSNGYFIASLHRTSGRNNVREIAKAMKDYGFKVLINDFFRGYMDGKKSGFTGAYILVGRKIAEKEDYAENSFHAFDKKYMSARTRKVVTIEGPKLGYGERFKRFRQNYSDTFRNLSGFSLRQVLGSTRI